MRACSKTIGGVLLMVCLATTGWSQQATHEHPTQAADPAPEDRVPVNISGQAQGGVGLKTQPVVRRSLGHTIRTVGNFVADQTKEARISVRVSGWIERIHADYIGKSVKKGAPLFDLYSPDLTSTQNEYLAAIRQGGEVADEIAETAAERMRLWGLSDTDIRRLKERNKPQRAFTFYAPVDGVIINKGAVLGAYVTPDTELYYLADLSQVWLLLTLYEGDVSLIDIGDKVEITLPYDKSKKYSGSIDYIYPDLDAATRTVKARVKIRNVDGFLRPGMFADAQISKALPEVLVVPDDAVIDTGVRRIVFVKTGDTTFEPREIKTGPRIANQISVLSGLNLGEQVVVNSSFLVDAESRMQAALRKGKSAAAGHGEHGKK